MASRRGVPYPLTKYRRDTMPRRDNRIYREKFAPLEGIRGDEIVVAFGPGVQ